MKKNVNILSALLLSSALTMVSGLAHAAAYAVSGTTVNDANDYAIEVDSDNAGYGNFVVIDDNNGNPYTTILSNAQSTAITTDGVGSLTVNNNGIVATGGLNNSSGGISNAGAISGVSTISTSGVATLNSASITNNATVGGTLGVTGAATTHGITNASGGISNTGGLNNNASGITNAGAVSGVTTLATSGAATLNSASVTNNATVGGTLGVTGATSLSTLSTSGAATLNSASITNNATVGGTLGVTGTTTLTGAVTANGGETVNNGFTAHSGTNTGNSLSVGATQTATVGVNTVTYGTQVSGGMLVNGDLGVNGNIYSLNPTANASVNVANNGLSIVGASNAVSLVSDNNSVSSDGRAQVSLTPTTANVTVTNALGNAHGLAVGTSDTVLSGGLHSTTMTLNDNGATFANTATGGGPATVTGVADGHNRYDAVNYGQLQKLEQDSNKGLASVSAMANIPQVDQNKTFSVGMGYGNYDSESALAFGGSYRVDQSAVLKASVGASDNGRAAVGVGAAYSW